MQMNNLYAHWCSERNRLVPPLKNGLGPCANSVSILAGPALLRGIAREARHHVLREVLVEGWLR
jgi:hypothetical protein